MFVGFRTLTKFEYLHYVSVLNPEYIEKNIRDLFNQFLRFLYDGGINEYEDDSEYAPKGCVSFLTIHQSKGLEFPVVICCSLEAVPRKQHTVLDELLEEGYHLPSHRSNPWNTPSRSTFVGSSTRRFLRKTCWFLRAQEKEGRGRSPSKYFDEYFYGVPSWRDASFDVTALSNSNRSRKSTQARILLHLAHHLV